MENIHHPNTTQREIVGNIYIRQNKIQGEVINRDEYQHYMIKEIIG